MSGDTRRSSRVRATNAVYNYSSDVDEEESDATPSRRTNRAQRSSQPQSQRGNWTPEEDHQLERLVNEYGPQHWSEIAKHLPPRAGKQCRERWVNFLDPSILKGDWTDQEDELLVQLKVLHGNHWADMSKAMRQEGYHRTDNAIKNRWNSSMKRQKLLWLKAMGVDISAYQESSVADLNQLVRSVVLSAPPPTGSPARSARSNSRHGSGSGKRRRTQGIAQGLMSMVPVVAQFSLEGEDEKTANNDTPNYTNNGNTATTTTTTNNNNNSKNSKNSDISDDENDDSNFCDDDDDDDNDDDSDNENGINDDINNNNNNTNNFVYKLNRQEPNKNLPRNKDEKSGFNYPNLLANTTTPMSMNEHAAAADNLLNSLSATPLIPGIATHHSSSSSSSSLSTGISLSNMHYRSGEELHSGLPYLRYDKSKPSTYTPNSIPHSSSMLVPLTTSTTALTNTNNISHTTSINNPTTTTSTTLSTKTTALSQTISRNVSQSTPGPTLSGGTQQNYRLSPSLSALSVSMFPNSLQNQSLSSPVNNLSQLSSVDTPVYTTNAYRLTATNSIPPSTSTHGCTTDIGMSKHTVGLRSPCTVDRNIDRNLLSLGQSSATQQLPRNATTASSFSRPSPAMLAARNVNSPFYTSSSLRWNDHPAVATTATTTNTTTAAITAATTAAIATTATTATATTATATTATANTANTTAATTTSTTTMAATTATTANTTSATTSAFKHVPHPPMNLPSMNPRFHGSMLTQCTLSPHSLTPIKARPVSQLQVPPSAFVPGKSNELLSFPSLNGINDNNNNINSNTTTTTNNNNINSNSNTTNNNNNKNNNNDTNSNNNNKNNNNDTNSNNNNTNNNNTNDTIKNIKSIAPTTTSTTVVPGTTNIASTNLAPTPANSGVYYNTPKTIMLTVLPPDSIDMKPQQNILQRSQLVGCTPTDMDLMNKAIENYLKNPKAPTTIGGVSTPLFAKAMGVRSSYVPSQITQNKQTNLKSKQDVAQKAQFMSKHSLYIPPYIPPSSIPQPSLIQPYIPPLSSTHVSSIQPSVSPLSSPLTVRTKNKIPLPPLPPSHPSLRTFSHIPPNCTFDITPHIRHISQLKTIHRSDSAKTEFSSITQDHPAYREDHPAYREDHSAYREENRLHQENAPSVVMVTPIKRAKPNNYNSVQSACNPSLQMVSLQSVNQTSFDLFPTCQSTDDDNDTVLATKSIAVTEKNDTSYLSPHTRNPSSPSIIQSSTAIPTSLNH